MPNVYIYNSSAQRKGRNGKIYSGESYNPNNPNQSYPQSSKHWEHGRITDITDITDNNLIVEFTFPFVDKPVPITLKVYRMVENIPIAGKWIMQDVLHYFDDDEDWVVKTGFSLFIDDSEPLTGVIVEYCFTE